MWPRYQNELLRDVSEFLSWFVIFLSVAACFIGLTGGSIFIGAVDCGSVTELDFLLQFVSLRYSVV